MRSSPAWWLVLAAWTAPALAQDPGAAPAEAPQGPTRAAGYVPVDGLAATVDDRSVTFADIDEMLLRRQASFDRSDRLAIQRASWQVLQEFVGRRVQAQGGAELGLAAEDVRRVAADMVNEQRRPYSALEYGARVRERGSDPLDEKRSTVAELYEMLWRGSVTGQGNIGGQRPRVDRYLRPTQLRAAYVQSRDVLGEPPLVELQVLDLLAEQAGGLDGAREEVTAWRQDVVTGEASFSALVRNYSATAREREGRLEPVRVDRLADPALRRFAITAEVDELSGVLAIPGERGNVVGYRLVRLVAREEGAPPAPFVTRELQRELRDLLLERADRLAVDSAGSALLADAEVWYHPSWRGLAAEIERGARPPR